MVSTPELKKYINKRVLIQLNATRRITGTLRGYDIFLNLTLEDVVEEVKGGDKIQLGSGVFRGGSVLSIEALEGF